MTLKNNRAPLLHHLKLYASFQSHRWIQTGVTVRKRSIRVKMGDFFVPCDLEIWWITLKNIRSLLLYHVKLCASFQSHPCIETGVTVRKPSIRVKIGDFLPRVTLKFDGWPWKTIGHIFHAASSFVHDFIAIIEFKLELQSGNTQFGSKSTTIWAVWPWNLTDDLEKQYGTSPKYHQALCIISSPYVNSNWSYSPELLKISGWYDDRNIVKKVWRTDGQTDRRTDGRTDGRKERSVLRAAWSHLKWPDCPITGNQIHIHFELLGPRRDCRERFPHHRLQRKLLVSDPGMHHGTHVHTNPRWQGKRFPAFSAHAQPASLRIW